MEIIESTVFSKQVQAMWTDEEYRTFQLQLIVGPGAGLLIRGSGGLRKIRWHMPGRGKRSGARVIYYWSPADERVERSYGCFNDSSKANSEAASVRKDLFNELVASVKEMKAIQGGRLRPRRITRAEDLVRSGVPDVAALRARFKLSQAKFAALLGISVSTLQNWEQHRREPEGPAKVLLRIAATDPEALLAVAPPTRRRKRAGRSAA